jgi:hypothetical protein
MGLQVGGLGRASPIGSYGGGAVGGAGSPAMEGLIDDAFHRLGAHCGRSAPRRRPALNMEEGKITLDLVALWKRMAVLKNAQRPGGSYLQVHGWCCSCSCS